nr:hypothetical protein [Tanacetum cinerariifolium]
MVATRNTSIKPTVEPHVQNWVNNKIYAQLTRFREVTVAIQNAIVVALSGPAGDAMRRNDECTSRGTQPQFTRMTKIEFPEFGGDDVRGWLYKCEQFFEIDHVSDPHKEAIMQRFGSPYDDPMGDIKNLRHTAKSSFNTPYPKRQLTQKEFQDRRAKNLCFYCDQKYIPGHSCRGQVFNLEVVADLVHDYSNDSVIDHDEEVVHEEVTGEKIHEEEFVVDAMLLPLGGCDMVLGVQWLSTLGVIKMNFQELKMKFKYQGRKVALRGTRKSCLQWMEGSKDLAQPAQLSFMVLCVYPSTALNMVSANLTEGIPTLLPPMREYDHKIVLKKGIGPIFSRPCRHPPAQKDAIEIMVKELLESGVIRPSQSPFSSPVVMVKKKDGTWRMCIDYKKLNAQTIKDKFPIPIIEELIDELQGVATDDTKIEAMKHWPIPSNLKQLRGFLGLTGYYRKFIKGYALISQPLTKLLKKNAFVWTKEAQSAFVHLKEAMVKAPVLKLLDFNEPFIVETDASGEGIGAVLQQSGHPIAYYSKTLALRHHSLSTYEKELLAVIQALHKWRGYLLDIHFIIKTDYFSLKYLLEQRIATPAQMKWLPKLMGFAYEIVYKKGIENGAADALSRVDTCSQFDPSLITLIANLQAGKPCSKHYSWSNQQLTRKRKLVVGDDIALRLSLLTHFHGDSTGGHSGIAATTQRIQAFCYWRKIKKQVKEFVSMYTVYQRSKPDLSAYPGLLQPLPIPTRLWSEISMDFVEGLSNSGGKTVIMVVVDRLSNDRDKIFLSLFWKELFKMLQVSLHFSTAYHPQSDGKTEVSIGIIPTSTLPLIPHPLRQFMVNLLLLPFFIHQDKVLAKVGHVAYKLQLPSNVKIHSVFHVSQLKLFKGDPSIVQTVMPQCDPSGSLSCVPVKVLDRKMVKENNKLVVYVLIQWSNGSPDDATWELATALEKKFLDFLFNS